MNRLFEILYFKFYSWTSKRDLWGRTREFRAMMKLSLLLMVNCMSFSWIVSLGGHYIAFPLKAGLQILGVFSAIIPLGFSFWKVIVADNYKNIIARFNHLSSIEASRYTTISVIYVVATITFFIVSFLVSAHFVQVWRSETM